MRFLKRLFHICRPSEYKDLVVSGIGYSEYGINFCDKCDKVVWHQRRTRDGSEIK